MQQIKLIQNEDLQKKLYKELLEEWKNYTKQRSLAYIELDEIEETDSEYFSPMTGILYSRSPSIKGFTEHVKRDFEINLKPVETKIRIGRRSSSFKGMID